MAWPVSRHCSFGGELKRPLLKIEESERGFNFQLANMDAFRRPPQTLVCKPPLRPSEAGQRDQAAAELSCVASLISITGAKVTHRKLSGLDDTAAAVILRSDHYI